MSQPADEEMETASTRIEDESRKETETVSASHSTEEQPGQTLESKGER